MSRRFRSATPADSPRWWEKLSRRDFVLIWGELGEAADSTCPCGRRFTTSSGRSASRSSRLPWAQTALPRSARGAVQPPMLGPSLLCAARPELASVAVRRISKPTECPMDHQASDDRARTTEQQISDDERFSLIVSLIGAVPSIGVQHP